VEYGWEAGSITPDSGEDFIVSIFDEGFSSGLSFYVQIKSTGTPNKKLANGDVTRTLKVKDIKHWEDHMPCVFLFAWDINERVGHWLSIADAIKELDQRNPKWRDNKTVSVKLPSNNLTDDEGFKRIRGQVARYAEPSVAAGRPLVLTLKMNESDPLEKASIEAFKRNQATGDTVEIQGRAHFVDWFARLHNVGEVKIRFKARSAPSKEPLPYRVNIIPGVGNPVSIHYIEMRVIKGGKEEVTLSNKQQKTPFRFKLIWGSDGWMTINVTLSLRGRKLTAEDERHAFSVRQAFAAGGRLQMIPLDTGKKHPKIDMEFDAGLMPAPDLEYMDILDKLIVIEKKINKKVDLPDQDITRKERAHITELYAILTTGFFEESTQESTLTISGPKEADERLTLIKGLIETYREKENFSMNMTGDDCAVSLFGQEIFLGPFLREITAKVSPTAIPSLKRIISKGRSPSRIRLRLSQMQLKTTFYNHLSESQSVNDS